jgi:hypothetical protein
MLTYVSCTAKHAEPKSRHRLRHHIGRIGGWSGADASIRNSVDNHGRHKELLAACMVYELI